MKKIQTFFWYCSGTNPRLLEKTETDHEKYVGIGATIFFTGLFAALAAGYALYTVFDKLVIASILGLIWGLMIFNLDRYIVSSMRKKENRWSEIGMALPRIALAILISIVIAKPLELKIFEKEINAELVTMKQEIRNEQEGLVKEKYDLEKEGLYEKIEVLKSEIRDKTALRDKLNRIAQQEADGTGGSGKRNAGPIYKIKKADADRVDMELNTLSKTNTALINEHYEELNRLNTTGLAELSALEQTEIGGPAARLEALSRLTTKSDAIWWSNLFIILFFIVIETAPIFVKLISRKGPYDHLLETEEYRFETAILKDKAFIHSELKKESEAMEAKEKTFVSERLDMKLDGV
ncbi:MAG: DUF4407 domain-containing protein [Bacteroidota bacterium]